MELVFVCRHLCGRKNRVKLLPDAVLQNHPPFCPKYKREVIISADHQKTKITKSDA